MARAHIQSLHQKKLTNLPDLWQCNIGPKVWVTNIDFGPIPVFLTYPKLHKQRNKDKNESHICIYFYYSSNLPANIPYFSGTYFSFFGLNSRHSRYQSACFLK
jgi:hypothetical protein